MNVKKLIEEVGTDISGKWMAVDKVELLISKVTERCILAVQATPISHARTTYDLDVARGTISNSIDNIKTFMSDNG